jgi:hypothetical protein
MTIFNKTRALGAFASLIMLATTVRAQPLTDRVAAVTTGAVTFQFSGRPGICGDGESFFRLGHSYVGNYSSARSRCASRCAMEAFRAWTLGWVRPATATPDNWVLCRPWRRRHF